MKNIFRNSQKFIIKATFSLYYTEHQVYKSKSLVLSYFQWHIVYLLQRAKVRGPAGVGSLSSVAVSWDVFNINLIYFFCCFYVIFYNNSFTLYPANSRVNRTWKYSISHVEIGLLTITFTVRLVFIYKYTFFFCFTLYPAYSRVGIAYWLAELNAALCFDTRAKKWKYKLK